MKSTQINPIQQARAISSLKAQFIGDSLAMPAHWFYRIYDIEQAFNGGIIGFNPAPKHHPSSLMSLHSTQAGGRRNTQTNQQPDIVGDVILKGKRAFWEQPYQHYHKGLSAGENTLNAHCNRLVMRCLNNNKGHYDPQRFLDDYIGFMTADPAQHPDTYAESYHRAFFANYAKGIAPEKCAGKTHDTASIGGLVTLAPLFFAERQQGISIEQVLADSQTHLALTHPDESLAKIAGHYIHLLERLWQRDSEDSGRQALLDTAQLTGIKLAQLIEKNLDDRQVIGQIFSPACYISDSWPAVLYLAYKYAEDPQAGLLANANLGGDNAHRGILLGSLLGLLKPNSLEDWFEQLVDKNAIHREVSQLVNPPH